MPYERLIYDTKAGITSRVKTLEGLHQVFDLRREAHYKRNETLTEFCVLGRWWLDRCGNASMLGEDRFTQIPKDKFPDIPDVLTGDEFWAYIHEHDEDPEHFHLIQIHAGGRYHTAPAHLSCDVCGQGWQISNAHQCIRADERLNEKLEDWVGRPFAEFEASLDDRRDGDYLVVGELKIRNDRFIDLRPDPNYPSLKINELGWAGKRGEIPDDYIVQPGDETALLRWVYYHPQCYDKVVAAGLNGTFHMMFTLAGFDMRSGEWDEIPCDYNGDELGRPWFKLTGKFGSIKIGWRRAVINIDWADTGMDLLHLFDDIDNTKTESYIHAYGYQQAFDIVQRIKQALTPAPAEVG